MADSDEIKRGPIELLNLLCRPERTESPVVAFRMRLRLFGVRLRPDRLYINDDISYIRMGTAKKPIGWLHGEIKTPPFSREARIEAGYLLRRLQTGEKLSLPQSRPMPAIGKRCHELRVVDETKTWRIVYRMDSNAILVVEIFEKKTQKTPKEVIRNRQQRLRMYDTT